MFNRSQVLVSLKEGVVSGLPLVIGYFPVAMAFGLLAKNTNISLQDSSLFSLVVFAGASQFMALDLINAGMTFGNIILATFFLNLRHLMMSASLSVRLQAIQRHWLLFIAFGITDESFSVSSLGNKTLNAPFLLALHGISYSSWVLGTVFGYLVGTILPVSVQSSLGIGLYAMFMALLVPALKKSSQLLILSLFCGILYAAVSYLKLIPDSWCLIAVIITASAIGALVLKDEVLEVVA
jgi:4-azaleucine resistance transporter AzlC